MSPYDAAGYEAPSRDSGARSLFRAFRKPSCRTGFSQFDQSCSIYTVSSRSRSTLNTVPSICSDSSVS